MYQCGYCWKPSFLRKSLVVAEKNKHWLIDIDTTLGFHTYTNFGFGRNISALQVSHIKWTAFAFIWYRESIHRYIKYVTNALRQWTGWTTKSCHGCPLISDTCYYQSSITSRCTKLKIDGTTKLLPQKPAPRYTFQSYNITFDLNKINPKILRMFPDTKVITTTNSSGAC